MAACREGWFLDPGTHPPQRGFRRKALTSSSGTHEQRFDLPKLLAQLRLAGHSDAPLPAPNRDHTITACLWRQSSRPRYPEHSTQVNARHGEPPVTLTLFSRPSAPRRRRRCWRLEEHLRDVIILADQHHLGCRIGVG
jgi:hypothetical protein